MKRDHPRAVAHREKMAIKKLRRAGMTEMAASAEYHDDRTPEEKERAAAQSKALCAVAMAMVAPMYMGRRRS